VPDNETVLYRGASFELGRGPGYYGIWPTGVPRPPSIEWWPETAEGWQGAWARFTMLEPSGAFAPVGPAGPGGPSPEPAPAPAASTAPPAATAPLAATAPPATTGPASPGPVTGPYPVAGFPAGPGYAAGPPFAAGPGYGMPPGPVTASPVRTRTWTLVSAGLLGAGLVLGLIGLFPDYYGGSSLASQSADLVPHVLYLVAWLVSAGLILGGLARLRAGALLGLGVSVISGALFLVDAALAITGGQHLVGAGLVLSLAGWVLCTGGVVTAFLIGPTQEQGLPRFDKVRPVVTAVTTLAAIGAVIAYAAPWDSYTLRTANGAVHNETLGNAFASPGAVIFANVVVMVAVVALALAAALWRPGRLGGLLLAGAVIPLIAQAISAMIQIGQNPAGVFGLTPAEANRLGITISSGLTAVFWVYLALVIVLAAIAGWLALPPRTRQPRQLTPDQPPASQHIPA
jgi:hypothetical protein